MGESVKISEMATAFVEPYYSGSHKYFADGVAKHFPGRIKLFTMPGRHWKWRMHGAAVTLAEMVIDSGIDFDCVIATSLIDLALFKALIVKKLPKCRFYIYFHENQLSYPWSEKDRSPEEKKDMHYGFINFTSIMTADIAMFNSYYNRESFFNNLTPFLKSFPDEKLDGFVDKLKEKSIVVYPGIDKGVSSDRKIGDIPLILWNHRWEYDKNPETFFEALFQLKEKGIKFKLAVAGEERARAPEVFNAAKEKLKNEIVSWGYVESREKYHALIKSSDFLPVTSNHEFFGLSVLEAASNGVIPILPKRLSYPELFPPDKFENLFYQEGKLAEHLEKAIQNKLQFDRAEISKRANSYSWEKCIESFSITL
jgi:glycosyltransferase involved in cell wall biosynthesis